MTSASAPSTGSSTRPFAEVLPPAKFVFRGSLPSRWDRANNSAAVVDVIPYLPGRRRNAWLHVI
jgi:hypothetical protein